VLGVYDDYLVEPVAKVLDKLGVKRAFVVYGHEKLDEISSVGETTVCELKDGYYRTTVIAPEDFGFARGAKEDLQGGSPEENAEITKGILNGSVGGTKRNTVLMNAGAALYVAGKAETMREGVHLAEEMINSGAAYRTMEAYIRESNI
jgi:anthranilate phosphoribosyltransferase